MTTTTGGRWRVGTAQSRWYFRRLLSSLKPQWNALIKQCLPKVISVWFYSTSLVVESHYPGFGAIEQSLDLVCKFRVDTIVEKRRLTWAESPARSKLQCDQLNLQIINWASKASFELVVLFAGKLAHREKSGHKKGWKRNRNKTKIYRKCHKQSSLMSAIMSGSHEIGQASSEHCVTVLICWVACIKLYIQPFRS